MRIVLTHEQADFDALASLLGAHLLDEAAVPILPRRLNRNVRAFLTLYGHELPFLDPRDLPKKRIQTAMLVDTQAPITIKGMTTKTQIHVIDHHPPRPDLPDNWKVTCEDIGAATTLLVEALRNKNGWLSMTHATLLLLGIYEDTGSLIYTRTTPRDALAVSYLLQQGANLQIAQGFLNHPLSPQQQSLYEEMQEAVQIHTIHGHTVVVACGDAGNVDEELSSIAHKLRDVLDPDALILLFTTRAGVQMIARSTNDYVNVGDIAAHFGGGGHTRASAALIQEQDIASVNTQVMEILPTHVQAAITVSEIMSKEPQMFLLDTPVKKAAEQMQRYGYEGFPVIEKGKVVGLLTRRAVDRAIAHHLNLSAKELMLVGEVTVESEDSIETLQEKMTDSGWGQIPVIDLKKRKVIGIVTRTDLLDTLAPKPAISGRENLAALLEQSLPPARLALLKAVAEIARDQKTALYVVGGFVRDLLLEIPSPDYDLVVEGDAIALAKTLKQTHGGQLTSHKRFGTAKWHIADQADSLSKALSKQSGKKINNRDLPGTIDFISARREFYTHPSALPTVERGSIKLDLHRRDFTINTLALRLDGRHYGELHDHWGGRNDINEGIVRVLHSLSFVDDPTRILRAVRFEQRFGFKIAVRTLELLRAACPLLDRVSGDRIRHELDRILEAKNSFRMLGRLSDLNVLSAIHPGLIWEQRYGNRLESMPPDSFKPDWGIEATDLYLIWPGLGYILWLIDLTALQAQEIAVRLKLRKGLEQAVLAAIDLYQDLPSLEGASPSTATARLEAVPHLALYAVHHVIADDKLREILREYVSNWRSISASITGHNLQSQGVRPGPEYRRILTALRNAWLDGEIKTKKEEKTLLEKLINE